MLQLLQPAGLLAIAGIIFPVIIHLWNRREGKTLKIGSVALLAETARQQARSLRIKDILLLILRCLIIAVLALLLAKPIWQKQLAVKDQKGWILLPAQTFSETYTAFKPQIDSLLANGLELHYFGKGFPKIKLEEAVNRKGDLTAVSSSYWAMLKQLNEQVPAELPVYLFTNNRLSNFSGNRPEVALNLHWNTYTPKDTASGYILNARLSSPDSVLAIVGYSNVLTTSYSSQNISLQNPATAFQLRQQGGKLFITSTANKTSSVEVDTATLKIVIYTDQFSADAAYLKAALETIKEWGKYKFQIVSAATTDTIPQDCNWLFWLSQKGLPTSLQGATVFKYEPGKETKVHSRINVADEFFSNEEPINLFRRTEKDSTVTGIETVWIDGFGNPLLALDKKAIYHFYSRFNPAWNDIVWSEQFPQAIFNLILKEKTLKNVNDERTIAANQLQPTLVRKNEIKQKFIETTDLSKVAWALTFLLFFLERVILFTRKKEKYA